MYIVIAGAYGFLGSYVVKECAKFGITPLVLERNESKKQTLNDLNFISIKYNNLADKNLLDILTKYSPISFLNIAWKGVGNNTIRKHEDQINYNLPFSLKTIELAKNIGCKHWLGIGSLSEYGQLSSKASEMQAPDPISVYGKSKLAVCWASSALCQAYNMGWTWVRLGSIFGPGDSEFWLIPYVINSLLSGESPELTLSSQICDYLFVEDAANAILTLIKNNSTGIFNMGSGNGLAVKEIIEIIVDKIKPSVAPIFGAKAYHDEQIMYMVANIDKLKNKTGWTPLVSISDGIDKTLAYFQNK